MLGLCVGFVSAQMLSARIPEIPIVLLFAYVGGVAPDNMEMSFNASKEGEAYRRGSIIPHRTITHWLPVWLLLLGSLFFARGDRLIMISLLPFVLSAIVHLLADASTVSGIPVYHPFSRARFRYARFKSGDRHEDYTAFLLLFTAAMSWFYFDAPAFF